MNSDTHIHARRGEEKNAAAVAEPAAAAGSSGPVTVSSKNNLATCGAVFSSAMLALTNAASAAAATTAVAGQAGGAEMGARLDAPAAISFGVVVVAFAFLQVGDVRPIIVIRSMFVSCEETARACWTS